VDYYWEGAKGTATEGEVRKVRPQLADCWLLERDVSWMIKMQWRHMNSSSPACCCDVMVQQSLAQACSMEHKQAIRIQKP
jgi:hypothetical protein